jgi:hypothetical protein
MNLFESVPSLTQMTSLLNLAISSTAKAFWLTIALTAIPGTLGGLTYGVSVYLKAIDVEKDKWPPCGHLTRNTFFFAQGVSGFGGAIAALLVIIWANRFPDSLYEPKSLLSLMATAFVSGYVANRLLPAIADSVYNKLARLAEKTDETASKVDDAKVAIARAEAKPKRAADLATVLVRASDYLRTKTFVPTQTADLLATLSSLSQDFPTNRTLNILLARTCDEAAGNRDKAIEILQEFIAAKTKAQEGKDTDVAAAYWNIANYYEFDFEASHAAPLRVCALAALKKALEIDGQTYWEKLRTDEDFKNLLTSEEGKQLVAASNAEKPSTE